MTGELAIYDRCVINVLAAMASVKGGVIRCAETRKRVAEDANPAVDATAAAALIIVLTG